MNPTDFQKKEIDEIEKIVDYLLQSNLSEGLSIPVNKGYLLKELTIALAARNSSLYSTAKEHIINIVREIFLSYGVDIGNFYYTTAILSIQSNQTVKIKSGSEFIAISENNDKSFNENIIFTNFQDIVITPLVVESTIVEENKIYIDLYCVQSIDHEIINNTLFYIKGSFFHQLINECLQGYRCYSLIESIEYGEINLEFFPLNAGIFQSFQNNNYNKAIEGLLGFLIDEDTGRFFRIKPRGPMPKCSKMRIVIELTNSSLISVDSHNITTNYFLLINRFFRDFLPFPVDQEEDNIPQFIERNCNLNAIQQINIMQDNKQISITPMDMYNGSSLQKKGVFWRSKLRISPLINQLELVVNISNQGKIEYGGRNCIGKGILSNKTEDIQSLSYNSRFTAFNNPSLNNIYLHHISHTSKSLSFLLEGELEYINIIRHYINIYKDQPQWFNYANNKFCTKLWNIIKQFSLFVGNRINKDFFDIDIIQEDSIETEQIIHRGNRYYIEEGLLITLYLNNSKYNYLFQWFFNEISKYWAKPCIIKVKSIDNP